jgi:hypothetical protein
VILRSFKMVHFRGLPEVLVKSAPAEGPVRVPLPTSCDAGVVAEAVAFALGASAGAGVVDEAQGFAYVELGLVLPSDSEASLFRGIDRRGVVQASLREHGGLRVTGGADGVSARLGELLGMDLAAWRRRVIVDTGGVPAAPEGPTTRDGAAGADGGDRGEALDRARSAVDTLQRALRVDRLGRLAALRHRDLLAHGARLRRERTEVDRVVDRETAERDRVRTRLRRVNEYRDQVAREEAREAGDVSTPSARRERRGRGVQWGLATCAALLLATLVVYSMAATGDPDRPLVTVGLGLAFLVAVSSYFVVAGASDPGESSPAEGAHGESDRSRAWRDALRQRFADLSDPDDPGLPRRLRERLVTLDERLAPMHARLEALDDTVTVFDVEAGRAARALHQALPEPELAEDGLPEGMDDRAAARLVHDLGDSVYATTIERDALLAGGVPDAGAARRELTEALRHLSGGEEESVAACVRKIDAFVVSAFDEPTEEVLADSLIADVEALAAAEPVAPMPAPVDVTPMSGQAARFVVLRHGGPAAGIEAAVDALRSADPSIAQVLVAEPGERPDDGESGTR